MAQISGLLDRRVRFERRVKGTGFVAAGKGTWEPVITVWANVQDVLPSRAERMDDGLSIARRPARIRMRYREGLNADMRIVYRDRIMQIVAGPAEVERWNGMQLGRREALEFVAEDYSTAGDGA